VLYSKKILKLYEQLGRVRTPSHYPVGTRLGRGFADVGLEEFILLTGERLLSLLTGNISSLDEVRREHLFEILTTDQLIAEIHQQGFEIVHLECRDLRTWTGRVKTINDSSIHSYESSSLEELLLSLLLLIFHVIKADEARCLKTVMVRE
jgi:hypothetical protein